MRLVEIRLLDGPNVYRLAPAVKVEVMVGRRRTWYGQRSPGSYSAVRLGASVPRAAAPTPVRELAEWVDRLHRRALRQRVRCSIHRSSEPGHWIVSYGWHASASAELIAEAGLRLVERPSERLLQRAIERIRVADGDPPAWISDAQRQASGSATRVVSISGTNGKSTTTRMLTHIARRAGLHVGTTTTDGVLIDEQMTEAGDFTGPQGARAVLSRPEVELAVLETARGGILLRGLGYESNDVSVLTNISADHLDLQGVHTLPELAEVKSVICRITRPSGTVVLNADDPLVAAVARRVGARVVFFSLDPQSARVARHLRGGGTAYVLEDGGIVERTGAGASRFLTSAEIPATLGGLARHNIANALAAAAAARGLGFTPAQIAAGLNDIHLSAGQLPGRLNLYKRGDRLVIVDYAHNEAGLRALLGTAEGLLGPRGKRRTKMSLIVGTAGDRPDDAIRAVGRLAAEHADQLAIKEDLPFLRGRTRESTIGELKAGMASGGGDMRSIVVYEDEPAALVGELTDPQRLAADAGDQPRALLLMCHAHREKVAGRLAELGFDPVEDMRSLDRFRPE